MQKKVGVLLVNLGTPDNPGVSAVRKYLFQFLNDPRVIDLPWLARAILVNLIIVPFRSFSSSKIYKMLWDDRGSSLLYLGEDLRDELQKKMPDHIDVHLAMRYQSPSMESVLEKMRIKNYDQIIILPLYPQYASSTTGSTLERAMKIMKKWYVIPEVSMVSQYWDHPGFIDAFVERGKQYNIDDYDHVIFSYHGLPVRQVDKVYDDGLPCDEHDCETKITELNKFCYKATCYATTRALVSRLNIPESKYTVAFQSRLDKNWLEPFSDKIVEEQAKKGAKKLLVFSPAFTADCLETTVEIGDEYVEIFEENGGEKLDLVPSLNVHPKWVETLEDIVKKRAIA
jgi:ferrochelatase